MRWRTRPQGWPADGFPDDGEVMQHGGGMDFVKHEVHFRCAGSDGLRFLTGGGDVIQKR